MTSERLGIIGTGRIARRFVKDVSGLEGIKINVIYNPHIESAFKFVEEFENLTVACDLEDLMNQCDSIYIASPHETHFAYIKAAIEANKNVICEKPLVLSSWEAKSILQLAKRKEKYILEAIKTKYCPGYRKLLEIVNKNIIGEIKDVEACFTKLEKNGTRELTNEKYGGSFRELGSYCLLPIYDLFGANYRNIHYFCIDNDMGIDVYSKLMFDYGHKCATVKVGLGVKSEGQLIISGTKGYILVRSPWWKTTHFEIHFEDPKDVRVFDIPYEGEGLRYEVSTFLEKIKESKSIDEEDEGILFMAKVMEDFANYRNEKNTSELCDMFD